MFNGCEYVVVRVEGSVCEGSEVGAVMVKAELGNGTPEKMKLKR